MSIGLATRGYYCVPNASTVLISGPIKAVVGFKPIVAVLGFKPIKAVVGEPIVQNSIKAVLGFSPIKAVLGFKPIRAILAEGGVTVGADIVLAKGTIAVIPFDLEDGNGDPLDATTATDIVFSVKRRIENTDEELFPPLTLAGTITAPGVPTTARILVPVTLTETDTNLDEGSYFGDLWVTIGGEEISAWDGKYKITGRVKT